MAEARYGDLSLQKVGKTGFAVTEGPARVYMWMRHCWVLMGMNPKNGWQANGSD
jgi:hypothetical protein